MLQEVWLYRFRSTIYGHYAQQQLFLTMNLRIFLETPKTLYFTQLQAIQKNTCQNVLTKNNPGIENFKPKKSFAYPLPFNYGVLPQGQCMNHLRGANKINRMY